LCEFGSTWLDFKFDYVQQFAWFEQTLRSYNHRMVSPPIEPRNFDTFLDRFGEGILEIRARDGAITPLAYDLAV
jgi:hypothetical protein